MRGGPLFWPLFGSDRPEEKEKALLLARDAFHALQMMGGDTLLIVPGRWEKGHSYQRLYRNSLQTAKEIAAIAERYRMTVGLENVENRFLLSPREWCELIDEVNSPVVRMYFDAGNVVYLNLGQPSDWLRDLGKNRICRIHVKDCVIEDKGFRRMQAAVSLGEGNVDWTDLFAAVREIGYAGWISVEISVPDHGRAEFFSKNYRALRTWLGDM